MSAETFDPEVVELLRQVVEDPASTLTRMPTERLKRWIAGPEEVISPHGSYLTKAERHLALAYREQAAWILLHACLERLTRGKSLVLMEGRSCPDPEDMRVRARRLVDGKQHELKSEAVLLRSIAEREEPGVSQLASASLRLVPSEGARNSLAVALHQEGNAASALRLLGNILANNPSPLFRSLAWENRGLVHASRNDYRKAIECDIHAIHAKEDSLRPRVCSLTMAVQLGDEAKAVDAGRRIGESSDTGLIEELANRLREARIAGTWKPTSSGLKVIPRLRDLLPTKAQRICDAFL